jgi:hypothetical protein
LTYPRAPKLRNERSAARWQTSSVITLARRAERQPSPFAWSQAHQPRRRTHLLRTLAVAQTPGGLTGAVLRVVERSKLVARPWRALPDINALGPASACVTPAWASSDDRLRREQQSPWAPEREHPGQRSQSARRQMILVATASHAITPVSAGLRAQNRPRSSAGLSSVSSSFAPATTFGVQAVCVTSRRACGIPCVGGTRRCLG